MSKPTEYGRWDTLRSGTHSQVGQVWLGVERACRGDGLCCMGRQLVCTMFCACGSGRACSNPFNTKEAETDDDHALDDAAYQDIDTDTDENGSIGGLMY